MSRRIDKLPFLVYTENSKISFDWDPKKAASNQKKHRVSFDQCTKSES